MHSIVNSCSMMWLKTIHSPPIINPVAVTSAIMVSNRAVFSLLSEQMLVVFT